MPNPRKMDENVGPGPEAEEGQLTKPKKGKPVEIPVPKRADVLHDLAKAATTPDPDQPSPLEKRGPSQ